MFCRSLNLALRLSPSKVLNQNIIKNSTSSTAETVSEKDPALYFFNEDIQKLLKVITRPDPEKVLRPRMDGHKLEVPKYEFMTDEALKKAYEQAEKQMWKLLQMPPVVKMRKDKIRILSNDPALQGFSTSKHVFTDITYGISNKERIIVVREPDGILRTATNKERDRINQIYFPIKGREVLVPRMFQEENLKEVLNREDYEFILDRTCIQFEPDHEDFHRVSATTYDYINDKMHFDRLRSTRHYGPMVFYLAWNKNINNLLLENIKTERIEDAALLIKLYYILDPSENSIEEEDHIKLIEHYIKTKSLQKLDHALKVYIKIEEELKLLQYNTKKLLNKF